MDTLVFDRSLYSSLDAYADALNSQFDGLTAQEIVKWAFDTFGKRTVLSSSFGIQSTVMLHLTRGVSRDIPVVWIDTGYLPKETYQFAAHLTELLDLDVCVYQSKITPARMEALFGKLYEHETPEAHRQYGFMRKVEPMQRALKDLGAVVLLVGVRADQTEHRQQMKLVNVYDGRLKICPILNWSKDKIEQYMTINQLEYHPLKALGYESVGDAHSSRPVTDADKGNDRAGRFNGKHQECGLHLDMHDMKIEDLRFDNPLPKPEHKLLRLTKREKGITLFTKPTCKYCVAAKDIIRERKWMFDEVSVPKDISLQLLQQIVGKPVQSVPQIFLDGQYIGGYAEFVTHLGIPSHFN
ncbi:putative glutaredoxin, phosphoadenosine phosphosulfate reductase, Thioredoxin-like superfamily [Plasmopara halstedii]